MDVERNPSGRDALYLECLNSCFPGWGDQRAFDWAFGRAVGGAKADRMLLKEDGQVLAGSAVNYRVLRTADGRRVPVGIMTGSWTLPEARGKGAFTQIIEESVRFTQGHGGALLLAFVTATNASFRRLEAAGSTLFETRYLSSPPGVTSMEPPEPWSEVEATGDRAQAVFERFERARPPGAHFEYPSAETWAGQLVRRPGGTVVVEVDSLGLGVIESHGDFDRLQALAPDRPQDRVALVRFFLARAQARGRRLFLFESSVERAAALTSELPLDAAPGYVTVLPAESTASVRLVKGRTMTTAIGGFALSSGDRM